MTFICGNRDGVCKICPSLLLFAGIFILLVEEKTSFPFILINPASGFEKPDKQLSSVLLPLPDGPNMAVLVESVLKLQERVNPG